MFGILRIHSFGAEDYLYGTCEMYGGTPSASLPFFPYPGNEERKTQLRHALSEEDARKYNERENCCVHEDGEVVTKFLTKPCLLAEAIQWASPFKASTLFVFERNTFLDKIELCGKDL